MQGHGRGRYFLKVLSSPVLGLDPSMGEGGRSPDEGTFATTISNTYSFIHEPSPTLSGTLSHARARERAIISNSLPSPVLGLDPSMGEGGRSPDEGTFATTISNTYSFIQEPSPTLSGTLSHARAREKAIISNSLPSPVLGLDPSMGEGGRSPDEGTFATTISNIHSFIQEALTRPVGHPLPSKCTGEGDNFKQFAFSRARA